MNYLTIGLTEQVTRSDLAWLIKPKSRRSVDPHFDKKVPNVVSWGKKLPRKRYIPIFRIRDIDLSKKKQTIQFGKKRVHIRKNSIGWRIRLFEGETKYSLPAENRRLAREIINDFLNGDIKIPQENEFIVDPKIKFKTFDIKGNSAQYQALETGIMLVTTTLKTKPISTTTIDQLWRKEDVEQKLKAWAKRAQLL